MVLMVKNTDDADKTLDLTNIKNNKVHACKGICVHK